MKELIVIEEQPPYRISVLTGNGSRKARIGETLRALWVLRQNGRFKLKRLLSVLFRNCIMSLFRASQQQPVTDTDTAPEVLEQFNKWETAIEGVHSLPQ